jgi:MFS family permease
MALLRGPDGRTVALVCSARALRDFGDGFVALLLPVYLTARGLDVLEVGVIATLALAGSSLATLAIGLAGARFDPRSLLVAASILMVATGLAFAAAGDVVAVGLIAFCGTINPSAGSVSIFVPLEHAVLARSAAPAARTRVFSRYNLIGALAAAGGALAAASPRLLEAWGLSTLGALRAMFGAYALLGVAAWAILARVPRGETRPEAVRRAPLGPSRGIVLRLAALFSVDAFAGGFVVQSLLALWLFERFELSLVAAGAFFFWTALASALSFPAAALLASRIGLINTMVFTHIPASLLLILAAFAPTAALALAALVVRAFLSQMDVPARSSYVMAVVTPAERTAAASVTSVPRSLAAAASPVLAGAMLAAGHASWPLITCGVLKIAYDLTLLAMFRGTKPPEEVSPTPR